MNDSAIAARRPGDILAVEQGFQDGMIARALPGWLRDLGIDGLQPDARPAREQLSPAQLTTMLGALRTSLQCRQRLSVDLAGIQGIRQFCKPLLQRALLEGFSLSADSDGLFLRHHYFSFAPDPAFPAGQFPQQQQNDYDIPLLDAALANFSASQASGDGLPRKDRLVERDGVTRAPITAPAFAACCRKLDLGERYQEHLGATLDASEDNAASGHRVSTSLEDLQRSSMLIDACRARSAGVLTAAELELVFDLYRDGCPGSLAGRDVHVRQLSVFQCRLEQIVVLDAVDTVLGFKASARVLVYIPGDPVSPWNAAADLDAFIRRTLGKRLGSQAYQRFFSRFVRRRDRQDFFGRVIADLMGVAHWASRDMDQQMSDHALPLFPGLAQACIAQLKDDAAYIAVPVAEIDRGVRQDQQARLVQSAWMIASVAGLFVPGLNALLLAAAGWDLLKDVFHAFEDWREGDARAALDHVLGVVRRVIELGVVAVATSAVSREWSLVDHMVTARLESGGEKLWQFDLTPFRSASPPVQAVVDAAGVYRLHERCWVMMENAFFEVVQRPDEQWQIKPVDGHGPLLRHNEAGAWRVWCEQPVEWDDTYRIFKRLGGAFSQLADEQIDPVLAIHGMGADDLRGLHVCSKAPEACLVDTVSRVALMNRIQALIRQLRSETAVDDAALLARVRGWSGAEQVSEAELAERVWDRRYALLHQLYYEQFPVTEATQELQRDFASLHRLAAEELLQAQHQNVTYHAADLARRIRCVRVLEAVLFDLPQNLDLGRIALSTLEQLPGASVGRRWQLFDGSAAEPLASISAAGPVSRLRTFGNTFEWVDEAENTIGSSSDIFHVLAIGHTEAQRAATGLGEPFASNLRAEVARRLTQQPATIEKVLGIKRPAGFFLPPQRLGQGRIGYPLSGLRNLLGLDRQGARNLTTELRDLYPGFNEQQVNDWLAHLRAEQRDPALELHALKQQLKVLRRQLRSWQLSTARLWAWRSRREFARGLVDCWRYLIPRQTGEAGVSYVLSTYSSNLDELPIIPAQVSFPHVWHISLHAVQLRSVPDDFLRAFSSLVALSITNARLRRLSLSEDMARRLQVLDLSGNQIHFDGRTTDWLSRCRSLVYLNLSHNPLRRSFSIGQMPHLRALMVGSAQLSEVPDGLMQAVNLHTLDLGDNSIRTLPFGFYRSDLWFNGRVRLTGNPLAAAANVWHEVADDQVPGSFRWLDLVNSHERDRLAYLWSKLEGKESARAFFALLNRLTSSADFHSAYLARYLALRVQRMLFYMFERPGLQDELFAHSLAEHCQDNATLRFSDLEVRVQVWRTLHDVRPAEREGALLQLGVRCWRLDALDHVAVLNAVRVGRAEESLEFALAYRLALVEALDLPIEHDAMLNPGVAALSAHDIARAAHQVRSAQSTDVIANYLPTQRFWREHLAQRFESRLRVPKAMHDELASLMERGASQAEIDALQDRLHRRELNLQVQLTRESMSSSPLP
ncbi:NEL-type E3 ubiquitin ligase domain-containing protein [Pseudomonas sp. NPDC089422]|uniref:NEL-type E3 ubiquitin ligase domain-containing protein n=1 Tax=Pseudomonas sp. NPDC089422 TaxID=3364466 RepID=UPI0038256331